MNQFLIVLACVVAALIVWQVYLLATADVRFQNLILGTVHEHNARVLECHLTEQDRKWYLPWRKYRYAVRYQEEKGPEHHSVWKGTILFFHVAVECTEDNPVETFPLN